MPHRRDPKTSDLLRGTPCRGPKEKTELKFGFLREGGEIHLLILLQRCWRGKAMLEWWILDVVQTNFAVAHKSEV
jgi:hypothetical protein